MSNRLQKVGVVLTVIGFIFVVAGGVAYAKVQDGYDSLQGFSEAQNVTLNYNEDGQLIDRGTVEGAQAILALLEDEWNYPVVSSDLNPDDPLVNTGTEYMYQMATVTYHTLHGTQTVVLENDVEYEGVLYEAGVHEFEVDGRYWTDFDRRHPIEGPARSQAWSGTAHGIVGELGIGAVTHSTLQMGLGLSAIVAGLGLTVILTGLGLIWASREKRAEAASFVKVPDTIPEPLPETELIN